MLEFHKEGIDVKFYSEDNEFRVADVFLVKAPDHYTFDENINILKRITDAMLNHEETHDKKCDSLREAASNFVQTMNQLNEDSIIKKEVEIKKKNKISISKVIKEKELGLNII